MTKQSYFWATPSGPINLMKAEDMPPSHHSEGWYKKYCESHNHANPEQSYQADLQAAKKSSVPIQDQERAKKLIGEQIASLNPWAVGPTFIQPGAIYGPFTVEYEIEFQWRPYSTQDWQSTNEHYWLTVGGSGNLCAEKRKVAILYDYTPEKDQDTVLKEFADKMSKQEDIPKDIQAVVNKRFWDMLDTPEKEESQEEGIRLLEKCDRTFESLRKIVIVLKEAEPEKLPELVHNIEIDFQGIQAVIRDYTRKQ